MYGEWNIGAIHGSPYDLSGLRADVDIHPSGKGRRGSAGNLFAVFQALDAETDQRAQKDAGGIEDQVVHVGASVVEGQLGDLDEQGEERCGQHGLAKGIQLPEADGPHDAHGDEHGDIADDVDLPAVVHVKQVDNGDQVDPKGEDLVHIQDQAADPAFHQPSGEVHDPGDDHDADVNHQQLQLLLPVELAVFDCEDGSYGNPRQGDEDPKAFKRNFKHGFPFLSEGIRPPGEGRRSGGLPRYPGRG